MFLIRSVSTKTFPGESFDWQCIEEIVAAVVSPVCRLGHHRINPSRAVRASRTLTVSRSHQAMEV